jgi:hypothetical protein
MKAFVKSHEKIRCKDFIKHVETIELPAGKFLNPGSRKAVTLPMV